MRRRSNRTRNLAIVLIVFIVATSSAGAYYYFNIYMPQYRAERERLLTLFTTAQPLDLDPALVYDAASNRVIINVFDRLVTFKRGTTEIEPLLATSWETPDSMTYIFTLRENVFFHDGTPFDADCVKYSFDRVIELEGPPSYLLMLIDEIEVLDTYKVKITLGYEFAPFLSIMAHPVASIVSPTAAGELGEEFGNNPSGTGPFKFESWSLGNELVLVANKDYFKGPPKLEKIVFKEILEASARKTALEQGEVDVLVGSGVVLPSDLPDLKNNPDIQVFEGVSSMVEYLGFNTLNPPLNDSRVREAIAYAIDYNVIINETMGGRADRIGGPIPSSIVGYKEIKPFVRDLDKARQLLAATDYSDGFDITLTYNIESLERRKVAEAIRNSLAEVGINVAIKGLDFESAIDEYLSMGHELMLNGWIPDYYDADSYLSPQFHSYSSAPYGANIFGISDPEIDALIDEGLITTDPERRLEIYQEAQERIVEQLPCVFLYVPSVYDCVRFNVKNWILNPSELFEAFEIYKQ